MIKTQHKSLQSYRSSSSLLKIFAAGSVLCAFLATKQSVASVDETWGSASTTRSESFDSGLSLKRTKKVGVGATAAGATGLLGINLAINLAEDFTLGFGYGFSRGFRAANLNVRQALGGSQFIPYFTAGYSNWFSVSEGEEVGSTTPGFFREKFLNGRERASGKFAESILYPGLGLEYVNKSGDWGGLSIFGEILYLLDLDEFVARPVAGIGSAFYF